MEKQDVEIKLPTHFVPYYQGSAVQAGLGPNTFQPKVSGDHNPSRIFDCNLAIEARKRLVASEQFYTLNSRVNKAGELIGTRCVRKYIFSRRIWLTPWSGLSEMLKGNCRGLRGSTKKMTVSRKSRRRSSEDYITKSGGLMCRNFRTCSSYRC